MVQAGFELTRKAEMPGGFGVEAMNQNRHLLGNGWDIQVCDPEEWEPTDAEVLFGNPPCSGFSVLSSKHFRGEESSINSCMWNMMELAIKMPDPQVVIFESVGQAYTQGGNLMRALRDRLQEGTGQVWHLTHVKHNAYSCGGAAIRARYFFVATLRPLRLEPIKLKRVPLLHDVIGDLENLAETPLPQPYRAPASWWARERRSRLGIVDGMTGDTSPAALRYRELLEHGGLWDEKQSLEHALKAYLQMYGQLPPYWERHREKFEREGYKLGFAQPWRWRYDRAARVITGNGMANVIHPRAPRPLLHREVARVMGFPDAWTTKPYIERGSQGRSWWGKGITVDCGRWIGGEIQRHLAGDDVGELGEQLGEREHLIDAGRAFKELYNEKTGLL
jgi:site-specific DNA-cytosine methylase